MIFPIQWAAAAALCALAAHSTAFAFEKLPEGYLHSAPNAHAKNGKLEASIEATIPLDCPKAWAVFTDFETMPKFLPGLERSIVKSKANGKIILEQSGVASYGIFSKRYQSTRELTIVEGQRIDSESLPSDEVPFTSSTTFAPKPQAHCLLRYTTLVEIPHWTPAFAAIGFAKSTANLQMQAMLAEMNRRHPTPKALPEPAAARSEAPKALPEAPAGAVAAPETKTTPPTEPAGSP